MSFAIVEARKFKSGPPQDGEDQDTLERLSERQERFLKAWAE